MKENFNEFTNRSYDLLEKKLISNKRVKEEKVDKSFWFLMLAFLCLFILILSVAVIIVLGTYKSQDSKIFTYVLVACVVLSLLVGGISTSMYRKNRVLENEARIRDVQVNKEYDFIFKLINLQFRKEEKSELLEWVKQCQSFEFLKKEKAKLAYARSIINLSEIDKSANWKIQELGYKNDKNEVAKYLFLEADLLEWNQEVSFELGFRNELNVSFERSLKDKMEFLNHDLNLRANKKFELQTINELEETFSEFRLKDREFGLLIDSNNKKAYEWVRVEHSFLEVYNSSDIVKTLLNHIYLVRLLMDVTNSFKK